MAGQSKIKCDKNVVSFMWKKSTGNKLWYLVSWWVQTKITAQSTYITALHTLEWPEVLFSVTCKYNDTSSC
jgi:hypothetical protein